MWSDALNPGVQRREVFAWAMYDFANSGYTTVVLTAVFSAYFVGVVAAGQTWGPFAWTLALGISNALVMVSMPVLGAWADRHGTKKRLLAFSTVGCVAATAALAMVGPGAVALGMLLVALSNLFYAWGESLVAAFLPELARPAAMGRVSGWGWSLGYLGGMLALGLSLAYVLWASGQGQTAVNFVPVTLWITAAIFALAALVTFTWLRERATPQATSVQGLWTGAWRQWCNSYRCARRYPDFMWLLACAVAYQGGVAVTIALAAIYAEQVIGFVQQETMALIFVLNIAAALGAFGFGYGQDRLGHKKVLAMTLLGWMLTCAIAAMSTSKDIFWYAALLAGLCMGSSQSAGRAMAGLLAPPDQRAEFYGLWTLAVRLASILGPLGYGSITWATGGNQRIAIAATAVLFVLGLLLLLPVNMARGQQQALAASERA